MERLRGAGADGRGQGTELKGLEVTVDRPRCAAGPSPAGAVRWAPVGAALLVALLALPLALPAKAQAAAASADPVAIGELLRNARLWQGLGRADNVRLVLNKILAIDGGQAQALLLLGELELREGKSTEAQRLLVRLQRGGDAAATAELQDLLRVYTRDLPRLQQLRLLRRGGNVARAAALARELFPAGRAPGGLGDEFGGLLRGVRAAAATPRARSTVPPAAAAPAVEDRYWPLLREAQALRDAGALDDARQRVASALALQPGEPEGWLLGADLDARQGRGAAAEAAYRALLDDPAAAGVHGRAAARLVALLQAVGRQEDALLAAARGGVADALDSGALRQAAEAEGAQGLPGGALRLLEAALAVRPRDPWLRHDLARLYGRLGQVGLARDVLAEGLAAAPTDAEQAYAAALAYASLGLDAEALSTLDAVPEAARGDGQRALAQRLREARVQAEARRRAAAAATVAEAARRRAERDAWRQPTDEVALFTYARRAADGRSSLRGLELLIVLTRPDVDPADPADAADAPERPHGHRWLHVDPVQLDAGALPAAFDEASEFGAVRASGKPLPAPLPQRARGLNLGLGWTGEERRWDIGVVGAGFEVPNLVGGWRQAFALRGQDASVELSRRVLTGGLLPYAGTRDPISGRRWGGVTLSAATLRVAADVAGWSSSASLRAGLLGGKNVAGNDTVQVRLASDRDWIEGPALRLNAGATLSLWHYRRNLGFHSFGHGGYYSPQRYTSLSLPVAAQGRLGDWSYRVRASVGRSWTFESDAPYYPSDPALQAAAGNPVHAGGRGGGTSTSLRAELERRLGAHWSAGASVFADRSAYYAPTQWLFYLRRNLVPQTGEVPLPRPVQPYSQF